MDAGAFCEAAAAVLAERPVREGIGTLGEKTLHNVCKRYFEPDTARHEARVGRYVADVLREDGSIVEVQTHGFFRLRGKLQSFLSEHRVTVVYPVAERTWVRWIDPQTGVSQPRKRSPRIGRAQDIADELYALRDLLGHPNLHFRVLLLEVEEARLLDGYGPNRRARATKRDRWPLDLRGESALGGADGFAALLPEGLPERFTSADAAACAHIPAARARTLLNVLAATGNVIRAGREGRRYVYSLPPKQTLPTAGPGPTA